MGKRRVELRMEEKQHKEIKELADYYYISTNELINIMLKEMIRQQDDTTFENMIFERYRELVKQRRWQIKASKKEKRIE